MATGFDKPHPVASRLLVVGVAISFALLIAGLSGHVAGGEVPRMLDWRQLSAPAASASTMLHLGILVLLATPVVTLGALAIEFVRSRESLFALLCFGILLLLGVGLLTGVR